MTTLMTVGVTIGSIGLATLLLGVLLMWGFNYAMSQPPVHDGIGGKDTTNLFNGCVSMILGVFCIYAGSIVGIIGVIIAIIALATAPPEPPEPVKNPPMPPFSTKPFENQPSNTEPKAPKE